MKKQVVGQYFYGIEVTLCACVGVFLYIFMWICVCVYTHKVSSKAEQSINNSYTGIVGEE